MCLKCYLFEDEYHLISEYHIYKDLPVNNYYKFPSMVNLIQLLCTSDANLLRNRDIFMFAALEVRNTFGTRKQIV